MARRRGGDGAVRNSPRATAAERQPAGGAKASITKDDLVCIDQETIRNHNLTIDWDLQQYIADMGERYRIFYGAMAVMDARTGDILALYGQGTEGQDCSLGLDPELAASIFKLVTATAAMERKGFNSQTMLSYTGNAHTLYKRQLTNKRDRWTVDISLAEAFAKSNNVVFGKLGSIYLGQSPIFDTPKKLGFWRPPLREIETPASTSFFAKDEYNLAELACGFNKKTRISPLHAAQIVTPALNNGYMLTPRIVRTTKVYMLPVMKKETARDLGLMMEKTVKSGTVAKRFRGISSDRVLKHVTIGGKSGSIDGDDPSGRRNWFVGFAVDEASNRGITIGCLLILRDRFRIEADTLSRLVIRHYFAGLEDTPGPASGSVAQQQITASGYRAESRIQ